MGYFVKRVKTLYTFKTQQQFFNRVTDDKAFEAYKAEILKEYDSNHFIVADPISLKIEIFTKLKAK